MGRRLNPVSMPVILILLDEKGSQRNICHEKKKNRSTDTGKTRLEIVVLIQKVDDTIEIDA